MEQTRDQIFLIENPLLDISIEAKDNALLEKYELQAGLASLASEKQLPMYDEIWNMEGRMAIPGGSALNSARATNFMLKNQGIAGKVTYFGSVGKDERGDSLTQNLINDGMNANMHIQEDTPTGTCAVIVVDKDRTLCANLAAACKYSTAHLEANMAQLDKAKIIYTTSFFITSNVEALMKVANYANEKSIPMGFNLSAVFLLMFELNNVLPCLEYADYIFANEDEAAEFGKTQGMEGADLKDIAKVIAKWAKKSATPRTVIVTYGAKPVIVAINTPGSDDVQVTEYPLAELTKDQIVDTNGAGDAFVGGFMSQLYQDKDIKTCIEAGIYLSREVVQRSGCMFPEKLEWSA